MTTEVVIRRRRYGRDKNFEDPNRRITALTKRGTLTTEYIGEPEKGSWSKGRLACLTGRKWPKLPPDQAGTIETFCDSGGTWWWIVAYVKETP